MVAARLTDEREHRRGLVLGLTLAEILLLLLFLILLALAALLNDLQSENETYRTTLQELTPVIAQLRSESTDAVREAKDLADRLKRAAELEGELAKVKQQASELSSALDAFSPTKEGRRNLQSIISLAAQIDPNDPPAVLKRSLTILDKLGTATTPDQVNGLSELKEENGRLKLSVTGTEKERDKFRKERDYVMKGGKGSDYPPCWFGPDDKPQFMFEIDIHNQGVIVRDVRPDGRAQDPAWRLVEALQRSVEITGEQFSRGTDALFKWSKDNNCRFFVRVRDATGETNKRDYKRNLAIVEGHFYKLLLEAGRPTGFAPLQKKRSGQPGSIVPPAPSSPLSPGSTGNVPGR